MKFKKNDLSFFSVEKVELSLNSTIDGEEMDKSCFGESYIYVYLPENIVKEINKNNEKVNNKIKKIDDEINIKIFNIKIFGRIDTTIFISKDRKNKLVNSLKSQLYSNIVEDFLSKLFDKDDYISNIINYIQNYYKNNYIPYEKQVFKFFFNKKEMKENLTISKI